MKTCVRVPVDNNSNDAIGNEGGESEKYVRSLEMDEWCDDGFSRSAKNYVSEHVVKVFESNN